MDLNELPVSAHGVNVTCWVWNACRHSTTTILDLYEY